MGLFDQERVFIKESGRRARRLAADVSDPAGGVIAVTNTDRGDGYWTLDVVGDPEKAWVGRSFEFTSATRDVSTGDLAIAFPFVVDGGRGRGVVLVEDLADVPQLLRAAGANSTTVLKLALEALVYA